MNDTAPYADARPSRRAVWPLGQLPLESVPPLATLAALAAAASMLLNQLFLPALAAVHSPLLDRLTQAAHFSANLAVIAGLITLVSCVSWALVGRPKLALRPQLFVFISASALVHVSLLALLFDPATASREQIYFGVVAANAIGVACGLAAVSGTRGLFLRSIAIAITALAVLNAATILLELAPDAQLDPWTHQALFVTKAAGELTYLFLLVVAFPLLVPRGLRVRTLLARSIGFAVLVLAFYAQWTARRALRGDYALLIYSAQRVSLWLDHYPLAYAVPFCLVLSATTTALLSGGSLRVQAATGMLLIFAAGYSTRAPGRLLSLAIGFMVLARALIGLTEHAPFRSFAPPPQTNTTLPP